MYNDSLKYVIPYNAKNLRRANVEDVIQSVIEERFIINAIRGRAFEETLTSLEMIYVNQTDHNIIFDIGVRVESSISYTLPEELLLKGMSGHYNVDVAAIDTNSLLVILFPKRDSIAYLKKTGDLTK